MSPRKSWALPITLLVIIAALVAGALLYSRTGGMQESQNQDQQAVPTEQAPESVAPEGAVAPAAEASPEAVKPAGALDLSVDAQGLSKSTVVIETQHGPIKFKFYPIEAPQTVQRMAELIQQGFYNGLTFHRVVPGFVIQGGDPLGNGTGGSGRKLKAEFNNRQHVEGAVAMARAADPDSADSQFYISLGRHPHLDNNYTVFGQVISGMDAVRKIQVGDKMTSVRIE